METASSPHDFKLMLAAGGSAQADIEQVWRRTVTSPPRSRQLAAPASRFRACEPTH